MPGMGHMGPMEAPTFARLLAPSVDWFFLVCCVLAAVVYLYGVARLRRRGDHWPVLRTVVWLAGLVTILAVTCTGLGSYGMALFSVHMTQHMVLSMFSPILLLMAAPITLALRALRPAPRGRRGAREILVAVLRSRVARVLTSPLVTLPLFIASLYGLYFTPLFDAAMSNWWGHHWMLVHFLLVGLAFFWPIMGTDPAPHRPPHVFRMVELFIAMPFHAFFGIAVMQSATLITHTFAHPPLFWGIRPLTDQHTGGAIAWAFSEAPTLLVLGALFYQWVRDEDRRARRADRAADRDGDAELAAYNAYLTRINQQ
ncbi:cytochrome c oxidase assembly protein [Actinocatenispora rupis]|uniref:Membrane protein n=1 Tax=Actinocatenispora rupis TaxID=519421 RepID=A0A8J3NHF1_9ACTN|nr:cytochrome c oxidase assembly protein [Actinocatenispora rupis]GID15884.1 membrane protein [Actinocatenispora rupis]